MTQGKKKLFEAPAIKINQVVVLGNGLITPKAMDYLFKNNIDVAYISNSGRYRGRLQPPCTQTLPLRRAQYKLAGDKNFCIGFSKAIVRAKIKNSLFLLSKKGQKPVSSGKSKKLSYIQRQIEKVRSIEMLLGIEGSAAARYFNMYRELLKEDFGFTKRIKHPPPDPINILLSLGYSLLFNFVHSMIHLVGFDPYQGFFHQYKFGHAALASDIMEPMRAPVVDTLVLRMINLRMIKTRDFRKESAKVLLSREGLRKYFEEYDKRLRTKRRYAVVGKSFDFKQIIEWQCRHLARVLLEKEKTYKPFIWGG